MSLNRILLIYTALAVTVMLVMNFLNSRWIGDQFGKTNATIAQFKQQLESIPTTDKNSQFIEEIKSLTKPATESAKTLGVATESAMPKTVGYIMISDEKWKDSVSIYEQKSYSSPVIAKALLNKAYSYVKKEEGWYQISLIQEEKTGWVSSRFFKEIVDAKPTP